MFTVKKVKKNEYAHLVAEAGHLKIYASTANGWAVVDENNIPICHLDKVVGKAVFEIFNLKITAQMQADWMGRNAANIEFLPVEKYDA